MNVDYDAIKDIMTICFVDENGQNKETVVTDYIENFDLKYLHPDDAELFLDVLKELLISPRIETFEIRSRRFGDTYLWYRLILESTANEAGYLQRIKGQIVNVQEQKEQEQHKQSLVTTDELTCLYNRSALIERIDDFLQRQEQKDKLHALFVLNLDNFKEVNESLGRGGGDRLLQECATLLRQNFRGIDIVGRTGGDEFTLLATDLENLPEVDLLASKLLEKLQWDFTYTERSFHVSASIGIAVFPHHGTSYEALCVRAEEALTFVKESGKCGYRIYNSAATRAIGFDEHSMEEVVLKILSENQDTQVALHAALEMMLLKMHWHRGWILPSLKRMEEGTAPIFASMREYASGAVKEQDSLRRIRLWETLYTERTNFSLLCEYDIFSEELRRYMMERSIRRILYYPFCRNGQYEGCIVLEDCQDREETIPTTLQEQVKASCRLIDICAVQFAGRNNLRDIFIKLCLLDHMDQYIYLVDAQDYTLKFINRKALTAAPEVHPGMNCYKVFKGQDAPCADCVFKNQEENNISGCCSTEMFNLSLRAWMKQSVSWFEREKDGQVAMIAGTDISEYFIG